MIDLTNKKFNKLLVTSFSHRKGKHYYWNVLCDCGNKKTMRVDTLKSPKVFGCGCVVAENQKANPHNVKHRLSHTQFSNTYYTMRSRCEKPHNKNYKFYGAKGTTCSWNTFEQFKLDMYESFVESLKLNEGKRISLDRIDNSKGYSKENCRWATYKEQGANRTNNRLIKHNNETRCLTEWAELHNMKVVTLWARISKYGWSFEKAISTPVR
jgi:hypothetical protein